jgi:hypothetical protein
MMTDDAQPMKYLQGVVTVTDHPLIYLNMPKAACTTIKNLLYYMQFGRYHEAPLDIHASDALLRSRTDTPEVHRAIHGHMASPHFVFTFVREPGRRAYSCFIEKVLYQKHRSFPHVRAMLQRRYGFDLPSEPEAVDGLSAEQVADGFIRFLRFVNDNVHDRTKMKKDAHWLPQSHIVRRYQQQFVPDLVGRVESFDRDFSHVLQHYRGPHVPPLDIKFNEGPKPPHRFEAVATDQSRALLNEIYGTDYHLFGYSVNA